MKIFIRFLNRCVVSIEQVCVFNWITMFFDWTVVFQLKSYIVTKPCDISLNDTTVGLFINPKSVSSYVEE